MIVALTAQRASFFHAERAYPASSETVKPSSRQRVKDTGRRDDSHGGLLFPPERGEHGLAFELCKGKPSLATGLADLLDQARVVISNVVDPGTDLPGNERSRWRRSKQAVRLLRGQGLRGKPARKVRLFEDDRHAVMDLLSLLTCRCCYYGGGPVLFLCIFPEASKADGLPMRRVM